MRNFEAMKLNYDYDDDFWTKINYAYDEGFDNWIIVIIRIFRQRKLIMVPMRIFEKTKMSYGYDENFLIPGLPQVTQTGKWSVSPKLWTI